jgi:hypothetical protein
VNRAERSPARCGSRGGIGSVTVPKAASTIAQPGWSINISLGRAGKSWQILDVGNVYP